MSIPMKGMWHSDANQEIAEKFGEAASIQSAAMLVGLEDHRRMLHESSQRLRDSHRAMMAAAGQKVEDSVAQSGADEMGDIILMGDVMVHERGTSKLPYQGPAPQPAPAPAPASGLGTLAKVGIAAALLGSGAAVPLAIDALTDPPEATAPAFTDTDTDRWHELVIPERR